MLSCLEGSALLYCVLVLRAPHDLHFFYIFFRIHDLFYPVKANTYRIVECLSRGIEIHVQRVLIVHDLGHLPLLVHVGSPHQLGTEVELVTPSLVEVPRNGVQCILQVALLGIEHHHFVSVVDPHHPHGQLVDS